MQDMEGHSHSMREGCATIYTAMQAALLHGPSDLTNLIVLEVRDLGRVL